MQLSDHKYEHLTDHHWLNLQLHAEGISFTLIESPAHQPAKFTAFLRLTREAYPILMNFQTTQEVFNLIKIGHAYQFDAKNQIFTIQWQLCANKYKKDFSVPLKMNQEPLSLLDQLRIENILLKKKLLQYEADKTSFPDSKNCLIATSSSLQSNEKNAFTLISQPKTQPEASQAEQGKRVSLIQCLSSGEEGQKQTGKEKNSENHKYLDKRKMIRKTKVKLEEQQPKQSKKRGRKKKLVVQTSSQEKHTPSPSSPPNTVKINFQNGDYYYGEIKNNLYHGHGLYFSLTNGTFEGKWQYGKANGEGVSKDPIGNQHSGFYINDKRNGNGLDIYINGERYEGNFQNDAKSGQGKYIYENGDCYEGQWKNDMYHGYGIERYCDGTIYEGNWFEDQKHGESIFTDKDGRRWKQKWERGTKIYEELIN